MDILSIHKKLAENGDVKAMAVLGSFYEQQKDYANAIYWYDVASQNGDLAI